MVRSSISWFFGAGRELTSDFLTQRQEACRLLEELKHTYSQIPSLFPWPGATERAQTCLQARQLQDEAESLQFTLNSLTAHKESLADRSSAPIWKDPSLDELESRRSSLLDELKVKIIILLWEGQVSDSQQNVINKLE